MDIPAKSSFNGSVLKKPVHWVSGALKPTKIPTSGARCSVDAPKATCQRYDLYTIHTCIHACLRTYIYTHIRKYIHT